MLMKGDPASTSTDLKASQNHNQYRLLKKKKGAQNI